MTMVTLDDRQLCAVTGGNYASPSTVGKIPGTTIYAVPPRSAVCNREQFDWMAARIGKGVQRHVVAADSALCGFPMPGATARPSGGGATDAAAQRFLDAGSVDHDYFKFLR
jgi:hypothetical protein